MTTPTTGGYEMGGRPIKACPYVGDDGYCEHPDSVTPECFVLVDGGRSDCPPLDLPKVTMLPRKQAL